MRSYTQVQPAGIDLLRSKAANKCDLAKYIPCSAFSTSDAVQVMIFSC